MRSGDALLEIFMRHFPNAHVSKILIQRDEHTAKPHFQYKKLSPSITSGNQIVITEPMIATGGSLEMAITLLKAEGVKEEDIMVASICAAPEGLALLNKTFPKIKVALTALDEKLNEKKYIVPGLGDFGDRFFWNELTFINPHPAFGHLLPKLGEGDYTTCGSSLNLKKIR